MVPRASATASPRRVWWLEYRGADGDAWGDYNGGWNTVARCAEWTPELGTAMDTLAAHYGSK